MLKKICIATSLIASLHSTSALAVTNMKPDDYIPGISNLISGMDPIIKQAIDYAQRDFVQFSSPNNATPYAGRNVLLSATANDILDTVIINKNYSIYAKIGPMNTTNTLALPEQVIGAKFLLSPVYNLGDQNITSWTCVTNIDSKLSKYKGDIKTPINSLSVLTTESEVPELRTCTYIGPDVSNPFIKADTVPAPPAA